MNDLDLILMITGMFCLIVMPHIILTTIKITKLNELWALVVALVGFILILMGYFLVE